MTQECKRCGARIHRQDARKCWDCGRQFPTLDFTAGRHTGQPQSSEPFKGTGILVITDNPGNCND